MGCSRQRAEGWGRGEAAGWQGIGERLLLKGKERTWLLVRFPSSSAGWQFLSHELPIIVCTLNNTQNPVAGT